MTATLWLRDVDRRSLQQAGGKGSNLGEMVRAGMPVPPGFIVSARAYQDHLDGSGLRAFAASKLNELNAAGAGDVERVGLSIASAIEEAGMPDHVRAAIESAYDVLAAEVDMRSTEIRVAVRSSATAEDLPDASFAGQQETFLNIRGIDAVLESVRRCWASLWAPRAITYRAQMGYDHLAVSLAVVVQVMVDADVAGVMFTANPMSGARDEMVITATYGLGEAVVAGLVTPDTFFVSHRGEAKRRTLGTKEQRIALADGGTASVDVADADRSRYCLTDAELRDLATLGRRVHAHYGAPQDTEWALAKGRLFLLQARPITHLPEPPAPPPQGRDRQRMENTAAQLIDHFPDPPKPIDLALMEPAQRGVRALFSSMGFTGAVGEMVKELADGRFAYQLPASKPSLATIVQMPKTLIRAYGEDARQSWEALIAEWEPKLAAIEAKDLSGLDAVALAELIGQASAIYGEYMERRFAAVIPPAIAHGGLLKQFIRLAVGEAESGDVMHKLMASLPYATARMNRDVAKLAGTAAAHGKESEAFREHFSRFLSQWGKRASRGMESVPGFPTWSEDPSGVLGLVDALLRDPASRDVESLEKKQAAELEEARERVVGKLGRVVGGLFLKSLNGLRSHIYAREEGLLITDRFSALMRRILQTLGARFKDAGRLVDADDIFFLRPSELLPLARGEIVALDRVARRRRAYRSIWAAHERGENWLITSGTAPWLKKDPASEGLGEAVLIGMGSSSGRATGPVCRVRGPSEFGKLHPGDVLVAATTAPAWTPLFSVAAAVVADHGNMISHAAIVAREYGIPAVLATGRAMETLRDGEVVIVDGDQGRVIRTSKR